MFQQARLKLTLGYLLIIMVISSLFSLAYYQSATAEMERVVRRTQIMPPPPFLHRLSLEELNQFKARIKATLIIINGAIVISSGLVAYLLAGFTLRPIRQMMDDQNQFISDASHELRTPLATLQAEMEAGLMEKQINDTKARKLIRSNLEDLQTLKLLTDSLLNLSDNHTLNNKTNISLHEVLELAVKKVSPLARKKSIKITLNCPEVIINGQKDKLTEAIVILLDNAIKYSNIDTKVAISGEKSKSQAIITIKDQGQGISRKDLPQIFDRFYRADKSRSNHEGYGLGLSIAKKIIENHQGSISVISTLDKGSTFKLILSLES